MEGQRDIQQRATIDGVVTIEPRINTMTYLPSIEAIEEFKVQSTVYSAEYGVNSGAQINVAIKSGTNSFHGTLFEFVRNDQFDARGFFLAPTLPKNKLRRITISNPFGGAAPGVAPTALLMLGNISADGKSRFLNNNIWQWTFEIERTFGADFVASIGYVGNKGTHLDQTVSNYNNPDPSLGDIQSRRPIQFYTDSLKPGVLLPLSTLRYLNSALNSEYHALHARAEKRFSDGLTFTASFNYQKSIATGYSVNESAPYMSNVPQNPPNIALDSGTPTTCTWIWQLTIRHPRAGHISRARAGGVTWNPRDQRRIHV